MLHTKQQFARIGEIIDLVKQQEPGRMDIVRSLKKCLAGKWEGSSYYKFTLPGKGSDRVEWKFHENIVLEHEFLGFIVLDVLKNGSIAGIEFINLVDE